MPQVFYALDRVVTDLCAVRPRVIEAWSASGHEERPRPGFAAADLLNPIGDLGRAVALGEVVSGCGGEEILDFAIGFGERVVDETSGRPDDFVKTYCTGIRTARTILRDLLQETRAFPTITFFNDMFVEASSILPAAQQVLHSAWNEGIQMIVPGKPGTVPEPVPMAVVPGNILGHHIHGALQGARLRYYAPHRPDPTGIREMIEFGNDSGPTIFFADLSEHDLATVLTDAVPVRRETFGVKFVPQAAFLPPYTDVDSSIRLYGDATAIADVVIQDSGTYFVNPPPYWMRPDLKGLYVDPEIYAAVEPIQRRRQSVAAHGYTDKIRVQHAVEVARSIVGGLPDDQRRGGLACLDQFSRVDWMLKRNYAPVHMMTRALGQVPNALICAASGSRTAGHAASLSYGVGAAGGSGSPPATPNDPPSSGGPPRDPPRDQDGVGPAEASPREVSRVLDVVVSSEPGAVNLPIPGIGTRFFVTAIIRLPTSEIAGLGSDPIMFGSGGPVEFRVDATGCRLLSRNPIRVEIPADEDSMPATFILEMTSANDCMVVLELYQDGKFVHQLKLDERTLAGIRCRHEIRPGTDIDLSLSVRATDQVIEGDSPHHLANLSGFEFGGLQLVPSGLLRELRENLLGLQLANANPHNIDNELRVIGRQLAARLPASLIETLRNHTPKAIFLRHDAGLDFPFELVLINGHSGEYFLGDRIPICRWYKNINAAPPQDQRLIARAAVLAGTTAYSAFEYDLLCGKCQTKEFDSPDDVFSEVFSKADYGLLHFIGHCDGTDEFNAALVMKSGNLKLTRIGALPEERKFGEAAPVIVLNGCGTANPYAVLSGKTSFSSQFLSASASVVIGTLWPIHDSVAHHFSCIFYDELKVNNLGEAMFRTKDRIATATKDVDGRELTDRERIMRRISVRSYCAFGHPNLQIQFVAPPSVIGGAHAS